MVRFRSSSRYIPATILCRDFSLTLTTLALYQRSLRRFEACSCKPAPRGHPSSLAQLRAHYKTMRSWRTFLHIFLSPVTLNNTNGIIDSPDPFIPKLPYDKAEVPVKRIDAFRIGDPGRGAVFFDPYKLHAPLPEVITSATTGRRRWKNLLPHSEIRLKYQGSGHNSGTICVLSVSVLNNAP